MKVLLAEDHLDSRLSLEAALSDWGYEVVLASDGVEALRILQGENPPPLAVLDWMMPKLDGLRVCQEVRKRTGPYTYLLLLTAKTGKQDIVAGLKAGADDYLSKPIDLNELEARLRSGQRVLELQSQLIAAREALREQATRDPLTGLWNRRAILEILHRELARSRREGRWLGVIMADLDHFKHINDTHGHPAGDAVLQEAARRMSHSLRPYDTLGRYGGEEFLIVLPGCDLINSVQLAERLRESLSATAIDLPDATISLTLSLGVWGSAAADKGNADDLIQAADAALYRAKHAGRNRVEVGQNGVAQSLGAKPAVLITAPW